MSYRSFLFMFALFGLLFLATNVNAADATADTTAQPTASTGTAVSATQSTPAASTATATTATASPPATTPAPSGSGTAAATPPDTSSSAGPFASLVGGDNNGIRPIKPMDLDAIGNKAVSFGNTSYTFLVKGSIPLMVWGMGSSLVLLLLGVFLGKRVVVAGVAGIFITLLAVVAIHYMPEIALTAKNAAQSAISH